jgi:hypothetical protein
MEGRFNVSDQMNNVVGCERGSYLRFTYTSFSALHVAGNEK